MQLVYARVTRTCQWIPFVLLFNAAGSGTHVRKIRRNSNEPRSSIFEALAKREREREKKDKDSFGISREKNSFQIILYLRTSRKPQADIAIPTQVVISRSRVAD